MRWEDEASRFDEAEALLNLNYVGRENKARRRLGQRLGTIER